jgi:Lrp/AsnC family transcriptional regulator, regulator for asnA, asnC and gidA
MKSEPPAGSQQAIGRGLDYHAVMSRQQVTRPTPSEDGREVVIDDLDRRLIALLRRDGRATNVELARLLNVTETTVRKRISALLRNELIEIVAVPTPKLAGFKITAIMGLSVELSRLREVSDTLVHFPEVRYCGLSTGRFDVMIEAFFSSHEHLLEFSSARVGVIEGVQKVETFLILDITKFSYEWEMDLQEE